MISFLCCSAEGIAIANGATMVATLELLVEKKVLTKAEARKILTDSIKCLEHRINVRAVSEAVCLMRDQMLPLFAEDRKEVKCEGVPAAARS